MAKIHSNAPATMDLFEGIELEEQNSPSSPGPKSRPAIAKRAKSSRKFKESVELHPSKECYLTAKEVAQRYGVCRQTLWRWATNKKFPQRVKLSEKAARWRLSDLIDFEASLSGNPPKTERASARRLSVQNESQP